MPLLGSGSEEMTGNEGEKDPIKLPELEMLRFMFSFLGLKPRGRPHTCFLQTNTCGWPTEMATC